MPELVDTRDGARALAERILASRERPLVVISTVFDSHVSDIDAARVESELGDAAEVVLLATGDASRMVDELLPDKLQVFGGAGRSYPVDIGRDPDIRRSPLRMSWGNPQRAADQLIADAVAHAFAAGAFRVPSPAAATATGTVLGVAAGRALVRLDRGGMASIWHELTWPEVPFEWTVHAGLEVSGTVDAAAGRFDTVRAPVSAADAEAAFPHHSVTLALVAEVAEQSAVLALHPELRIRITRADVSPNERDLLTLLLSEGDVVPVRVLHLQGGVLHLQLLDVEDDEPVLPALALLPGGQPWLREDRPLHAAVAEEALAPEPEPEPEVLPEERDAAPARTADPAPSPAPATPASASPAPAPATPPPGTPEHRTALQSTQLALAEAKQRIARLEQALADAGADDSRHARLETEVRVQRHVAQQVKVELADALGDVASLKEQLSAVRRELRSRARDIPDAVGPTRADRRAAWTTDEQWLRHEIYLAWVERVAASDRSAWPLPSDYRMSTRLAESLASLDGGLFDKALKAIVDVLTGRVRDIPGRELHPLRRGEAGNAPVYVRHEDGARCFRVYVEQKVPAARRLHFWMLADGGVELERVVSHDVVEP